MINDDYLMGLALAEAKKAFQKGETPVGAILVLEDRIIASAHNRKESTNDPTAHAELIVMRKGAEMAHDWRLTDAVLYVTKEPCIMCAGAMINARLGKLVFGCTDDRFGAVNSRYQLLHDPGLNHRVRVLSGVLEHECADILKKFFNMRR